MPFKAGYTRIPDSVSSSARDRYPEFEDRQVDFLGLLDSCMEGPKPTLRLSKVAPGDLSFDSTINFFKMALPPTVGAVILYGVSRFISQRFLPTPFLNAMVLLLTTVSPLRTRINCQLSPVMSIMERIPEAVAKAANSVVKQVDSRILLVRRELAMIVGACTPTIDRAVSSEQDLRKMDPNIVIPDLQIVSGEIDDISLGEAGVVAESMAAAKDSLLNESLVPPYLKSHRVATTVVVLPVLVTAFLIQLLGAVVVDKKKPHHAFQAILIPYAIALGQLLVVYWGTTARVTAWIINRCLRQINKKASRSLLDCGTRNLIAHLMVTRLGRVKEKTLQMIQHVNILDALLEKVPGG